MNVRFLFVFPVHPLEAAFALQLLGRIQASFEDVWTGLLVPESLQWITTGSVQADEVWFFRKTPGEYRSEIKDFLPDYLIDLSGDPGYWLFRRRTQLIAFTLHPKLIKSNRLLPSPEERFRDYEAKASALLDVFDLASPERRIWIQEGAAPLWEGVLPESYHSGYGVMSLTEFEDVYASKSKQILRFLTMLEAPMVLLGEPQNRSLGDLLTQQLGCTVFNTCGDLDSKQIMAVLSGANAFMGTSETFRAIAFLKMQTPFDIIPILDQSDDLSKEANRLRNQIRKT